jgi:hypothetical protein
VEKREKETHNNKKGLALTETHEERVLGHI